MHSFYHHISHYLMQSHLDPNQQPRFLRIHDYLFYARPKFYLFICMKKSICMYGQPSTRRIIQYNTGMNVIFIESDSNSPEPSLLGPE